MENTHTHFPCQTLEPKSDSWQLRLGPHRAHVLGCIEGQCFGIRTGSGKARAEQAEQAEQADGCRRPGLQRVQKPACPFRG